MSTDRGKDEDGAVHTLHIQGACTTVRVTVEYCSAIKWNTTTPCAAAWTDLEIITPSGVSPTEKDKYHVISLSCGI